MRFNRVGLGDPHVTTSHGPGSTATEGMPPGFLQIQEPLSLTVNFFLVRRRILGARSLAIRVKFKRPLSIEDRKRPPEGGVQNVQLFKCLKCSKSVCCSD